jgi:hypothetical protein
LASFAYLAKGSMRRRVPSLSMIMVLEGAGHVQADQRQQAEVEGFVHFLQQVAEVFALAHQVGQRQHAEIHHLEALGRAHQPARQRHQEHQQVEQVMGALGDLVLPGRHRQRGRRAVGDAPQDARHEEQQHGDADPLVVRVELELVGDRGSSCM